MGIKHTPGPWKCIPISDRILNHHRGFEIRGPETEKSVRDVLESEKEANARLISASPDLLEVCNVLKRMFNDSIFIWGDDDGRMVRMALKMMDEAIAKAEGVDRG